MNRNGQMSYFSNYGKASVDLAAPGEAILSTIPGNSYGNMSGTSMATPYVSGVAALLVSHTPSASLARIKRVLLDGVDPVPAPLCGRTVSDGCVNAARSLTMLAEVAAPEFTPKPGFFDTNMVTVTITCATPGASIFYTTNGISPDQSSTLYTNPVTICMGTTLKATAYLSGQNNSRVISGMYDWSRVRVKRWALNVNPGWTTNGLWEFGRSVAGWGAGRNPGYAATGNYIYGYNLDGNYEPGITQSLTTLPIDCSGYNHTQLRFYRWLCLKLGSSSVQISTNGTDWVDVWAVAECPHTIRVKDYELGWKQKIYDISSVADGQPTVYIRWVMGPTSTSSQTWCGWNIDDIEIWSSEPRPLKYSETSWSF